RRQICISHNWTSVRTTLHFFLHQIEPPEGAGISLWRSNLGLVAVVVRSCRRQYLTTNHVATFFTGATVVTAQHNIEALDDGGELLSAHLDVLMLPGVFADNFRSLEVISCQRTFDRLLVIHSIEIFCVFLVVVVQSEVNFLDLVIESSLGLRFPQL